MDAITAWIKYIRLFGSISPSEEDLIAQSVKLLTLKKDEYFSEAGENTKRSSIYLQRCIEGSIP